VGEEGGDEAASPDPAEWEDLAGWVLRLRRHGCAWTVGEGGSRLELETGGRFFIVCDCAISSGGGHVSAKEVLLDPTTDAQTSIWIVFAELARLLEEEKNSKRREE
jgi:hypothetical protein